MILKKFVKECGGVTKFSKLLGIKNPTIRAWLRGDSQPRAKNMIKILKLGRDMKFCITPYDIYSIDLRVKKGAKKNAKRN